MISVYDLWMCEGGIGSNFSDVFVVESTGPLLQMSRLPWRELGRINEGPL
jgi:hypothetical protein